jgi:glutamyl-Q tRNA(Asp) synthetase
MMVKFKPHRAPTVALLSSIATPASYRGRFAPSPTGPLHLGSLVAALGSWLFAQRAGGQWLVRVEDIDPPREVPGAAADILATLRAFGMPPDEPVWHQSQRAPAYEAALAELLARGVAFHCPCSRSDLEASGGVHRGPCRPSDEGRPPAIRLRVPEGPVGFVDRIQGGFQQDLATEVGDFVLKRTDGLYAYQLAVVVDDAAQGITDVVRGADLIDSTPRQILLQRCLGLPTPRYAHVPVLLDGEGRKLAKSAGDAAVCGADPMPVLRRVLAFLGQPEPGVDRVEALLADAARHWDIRRVPRLRGLSIAG